MNAFDALDPTKGCNPILPANVPIDEVVFTTLIPVAVDAGTERDLAEIPLATLYPKLVDMISVTTNAERVALMGLFNSGAPSLTPNWAVAPDALDTALQSAEVDNVGALLLERRVRLGDEMVAVEVSIEAARALAEGHEVRLPLAGPMKGTVREIAVRPNLALADGDYIVFLDPAGQERLFRDRTVEVARAGLKTVAIAPADVDALLASGEGNLVFVENDNARLRVILHQGDPGGAAPRLLMRPSAGEVSPGGAAVLFSLADRIEMRLAGGLVPASRSQAMAASFVVEGAGTVAPPAPPGVRATTFGSPPPPPGTPPGLFAAPPPPPPQGAVLAAPPPPPPPGFDGGPVPPVLPKLQVMLYLPYRQSWALEGYSRGVLLNSVSLAPQEETTIEVFSWERRRREAEESSGTESESAFEGSLNNKDTTEVIDEARRENGWKLDAGIDVAVPSSPVKGSVDFSTKDELTTTAKTTATQISDATLKATTKVKATRQTKVVETSEFGTETKVVRRLRNPNLGRTLNLDIFEVLAHYKVATKVATGDVRLAVLAPMHDFLAPILDRGPGWHLALLTWQHVLEPAVPATMKAGFAGARKLLADARHCERKCAPPCSCEPKLQMNPPPTGGLPPQTREASLLAELAAAMTQAQNAVDQIAAAGHRNLNQTLERGLFGSPKPSAAQYEAGEAEVRRYLYRRVVLTGPAARFWAEAQRFARSAATEALARQIVSARQVQGTDVLNTVAAFILRGPRIAAEVAEILIAGSVLVPAHMTLKLGFEDAGLETALNQMERVLKDLDALRTPPPAKEDGGKKDEDTDGGPAGTVKQTAEDEGFTVRDLAAASIDVDVLISHLAINANSFRTRMWQSVDAADRLRFLAAYGQLGALTTGRILGFSGTSAVLELNIEGDAHLRKLMESSITANADLIELSAAFDAVLPTPGVTLEARLGACDALEPYLAESRNIELVRLRHVAEQAGLESQRMKERIAAKLLDDPKPAG